MIYQVVSKIQNGQEVLINPKGCEDIEINDLNSITCISNEVGMCLVGLDKRGLFRFTRKSYKNLIRELTAKGIIWRFNYTHRI